jgi:hypothetical protein
MSTPNQSLPETSTVSFSEARQLLGVPSDEVKRMVRRGLVEQIQIGRSARILRESIRKLIAVRSETAKPA